MATLANAHTCPICRKAFDSRDLLELHVPDCSVADALDKVTKQDIPGTQKLAIIADLGNIARAFTFAHAFDDASEAERTTMYVCTECYAPEQNHMPAPHCGVCGRSGTMMLASEFVDALIEGGDETPRHLLN